MDNRNGPDRTVCNPCNHIIRAKELREAVSAPLAKYFVEHLSDLIKDSKSTIFTTCVLNSLDSKVSLDGDEYINWM